MNTRTYRVNQNIYACLCHKNAERSTIKKSERVKKNPFGPSRRFPTAVKYILYTEREMWRDVTEQEWLDNSRMNVVSGKIAYFRSITYGYM